MDQVSSFYQALFGGALTFYGIAVAVIIGAFQIVQSNLNFRISWQRLLGRSNAMSIIGATVCNIILIGMAAVGTSFGHDIIHGEQHSYRAFGSLWYLTLVMLSTVWLIVSAILCTRKILASLLPSNLINDVLPDLAPPTAIANYVLYRYASEPHKPFVVDIMRFASSAKPKKKTVKAAAAQTKPGEAKKLLDKATSGNPVKLKEELAKYERIKAQGRKSTDPLLPLVSVMRSAVRENDTQTLAQAHDQFVGLLLACKTPKPKDLEVGDSMQSQVNNCLINYYVDVMTSIFDMSVSSEAFNCSKEIVRLTFDATERFKDIQNWSSKSLLYNFWEYSGTVAINKDLPPVFISVLQQLSELTISQIRKGNSDEKEEDALQKLTRLIEKRFMHAPPDKEPTLDDRSSTSDYSEIMNALLNIGSAYENNTKTNPYLYLVAVSFVCKHLVKIYLDEQGSDERIQGTIVGFIYDHVSIARNAAFNGDSKTFQSCFNELRLFDWRLEDDNELLDYFRSNVLTALIELGDIAIKHRGKLGTNEYYKGHEKLCVDILEKLSELHAKWPIVKPEIRTINDLIVKAYDGEAGSFDIVADFAKKIEQIFPNAD
ncbi:MAG TPA: hypothetical protein VHT70_00840 [Candidatus Saccharimonadales bacterium]|jgi:hypothetical protein|nr:hypothetical protein [Candidatus Saccharimonadales bacterium]